MKAWQQLLSDLEDPLGAAVVDKWLRSLKIVRFDAANLYLEANDPMQAAWFEEHIRPRIKKTGFYSENHRAVKIHLEAPNTKKQSSFFPSPAFAFRMNPLDPEYTLENFVVSAANAMPHKLFSEWASKSSCPFNPIFLYGPPKSGKTHLLMGAAHKIIAARKKCLYATAATFTEHVVQAIRSGRMQEFRNIYRDTDVLMIDNVDQLAGRAATQEEFFHTFNTLHTLGKQIVLSSELPPSKLTEIESRLISRFEWGISVGLEKSETEEVLRQKALQWNIPLGKELCAFLLRRFPTDPVMALQALAVRGPSDSKELTAEVAEHLLPDMLRKEEEKAISPEKIVKALSTHFGIKSTDLTGKAQSKEIALPRQIAMYLCREMLKMPFQAIGKFFGRDHSTVMSSAKQIQKRIDEKDGLILEAVDAASRNVLT